VLAYVNYFYRCFRKHLVYRFDHIVGVLGTIIQIFVYVSIWKALYAGRTTVDGIDFRMVATNFVLCLAGC